jgi:hypothetical protein
MTPWLSGSAMNRDPVSAPWAALGDSQHRGNDERGWRMPFHLNAFSRAYGPRSHACGTWASLPRIPVYRHDAPLLACHVAQ